MTLAELNTLLKTTGYPVAYNQFKVKANEPLPSIPFITYTATTDEYGGDLENLIEALDVRVELYTDKKDLTAERAVKNVLNFVEFTNGETYIDSENMFMNSYEFTLTQKIGG